jgi:ABC-type Fe3+ transport system substrate-binding protein
LIALFVITTKLISRPEFEKANPKTDVRFGGTADPRIQSAEQDLTTAQASPQAARLQALAAASGSLTIPSHKDTALHSLMPPAAQMKFIAYDLKTFRSNEERTRLIGRWDKEVQAAPK